MQTSNQQATDIWQATLNSDKRRKERKRKGNATQGHPKEKKFLLQRQKFRLEKNILFWSVSNGVSGPEEYKAWQEITSAINTVCAEERTLCEIKKKTGFIWKWTHKNEPGVLLQPWEGVRKLSKQQTWMSALELSLDRSLCRGSVWYSTGQWLTAARKHPVSTNSIFQDQLARWKDNGEHQSTCLISQENLITLISSLDSKLKSFKKHWNCTESIVYHIPTVVLSNMSILNDWRRNQWNKKRV